MVIFGCIKVVLPIVALYFDQDILVERSFLILESIHDNQYH